LQRRRDCLHRFPLHDEERRAQRLVTPDDLVHAPANEMNIGAGVERDRNMNVVKGVAGGELRKKPQPLLREGGFEDEILLSHESHTGRARLRVASEHRPQATRPKKNIVIM